MGTQINFDTVPKDNPMAGYFQPGYYLGTVKKTEVKVDKKGNDYLIVTFNLVNSAGASVGTFSDFIRNTDSQIPLYKLGRMVQAMGLQNLSGTLELKLLAKAIPIGKVVALEIGDNEYQGKVTSQIQIAGSQCYWPAEMYQGLIAANAAAPGAVAVTNEPNTEAPADDTVYPFDAADGVVPPAANPPEQAATGHTTTPAGGNY